MALMISIMNQLLRSGVPADATECATSCGNLLRNTGHEDIERQTLDTLSFIARDETVRVALPVIDEVFSIQFRTFDQPTIELANEVSGTVVSWKMMDLYLWLPLGSGCSSTSFSFFFFILLFKLYFR